MKIAGNTTEVVIPKENAVFWMDGRGRWHNRHGPFTHKKIIDYFNRAIARDDQGFFVTQARGDVIEKVYFAYEETALFITDLTLGDPIRMTLNTRKTVVLNPGDVMVYQDGLYHRTEEGLAKFSEHALVKISKILRCDDGAYMLRLKDENRPVHEVDELPQ